MNASVPEERLLQRIIDSKKQNAPSSDPQRSDSKPKDAVRSPAQKNPEKNRRFFWPLSFLFILTGSAGLLLDNNDWDVNRLSKTLTTELTVFLSSTPAPSESSAALPSPPASSPPLAPSSTVLPSSKMTVPAPKELKQIPPPDFLILRGVLDEDQEDKSALVENTRSSQSQNLREGDLVLNYKVASIEKRRVVFTNGEESFTLSL